MSVDLERDDKLAKAALASGGAMVVVFLITSVVLWVLPTATRGGVSGGAIGLPFSGVGACALTGAGLLIAGIGYSMLRRGRHHRAPEPPLRETPPPTHGAPRPAR